eukprot:Tbor_TRINITY_DN5356_c4_g3::TRINITY_DN5356_c4_g3_i1::g.4292::m.4292/K04532/NAE1, APPBP1; amyloid beta precursor protein binding protein 1
MTLVRSYHDTKYVHNIRIWGADAQKLLEETHLLVLGCSPSVCQVVKSLVLPGVGRFTIVDNREISDEDRTSNYFIYSDNKAHERETHLAKSCCFGLCDLHKASSNTPGVFGEAILQEPNTFVTSDEASFRDFLATMRVSFVLISSQIISSTIVKLAPILEGANIPSALIIASGFVGSVRLCSPSPIEVVHCIPSIDTLPLDLRITAPFPALKKWLEGHNPFAFTSEIGEYDLLDQIAHLPWFSVVWNAIELWRKEKEKESSVFPTRIEMRSEVVEIIIREEKNITGGHREFENFEVAKRFCGNPIDVRNRVPRSTMEAIQYSKRVIANGSVPEGSNFPFVCAALDAFYHDHDRLYPLKGELPDFPTFTHWYVELCNIFKKQAQVEAEEVLEIAKVIKKSTGHDPSNLSLKDVAEICSNAWELAAVEYTPLSKEFSDSGVVLQAEGNTEDVTWYLALRAAQYFRNIHGRFPGSIDTDFEKDIKIIHADDYPLMKAVTTIQSSLEDLSHKIEEVSRGGGGEIASTASFLGGLAAEEVIKIIQRRRKPISDAIVFNGITMSVTIVKLLERFNEK